MSNNTSVQNSLPAKVEFISFHKPILEAGTFTFKIQQSISSTSGAISEQSYQTATDFAVYGERFSLNPQEIKSVFPPVASLGDHSNVLPNIVINRSTLPWERQADANSDNIPWLALLLFEEEEKPEPKIITLQELKNIQSYPAKFPDFELESGQHQEDKVTIIDVAKQADSC